MDFKHKMYWNYLRISSYGCYDWLGIQKPIIYPPNNLTYKEITFTELDALKKQTAHLSQILC